MTARQLGPVLNACGTSPWGIKIGLCIKNLNLAIGQNPVHTKNTKTNKANIQI